MSRFHVNKLQRARKIIAGVIAFVLASALLLGAEYAWRGYARYRTDEPPSGARDEVHVLEDFQEVGDWKVTDPPIDKRIRVMNTGQLEAGGCTVYIRLKLKEYFEIGFAAGAPESLIDGVVRASPDIESNDQHGTAADGACGYTIHTWQPAAAGTPGAINTAKFATYINWVLGVNVMPYTDWIEDPKTGGFWILDDTNDDGWAYWAQALLPDDDQTADLIESVRLVEQPDGPFYYVIHTEMDARPIGELIGWDDEIVKAFRGAHVKDVPSKFVFF